MVRFFEMSYVSTCKLVLQYKYTGRNDVKPIRQRGREREGEKNMNKNRERERKGKKERMKGATKEERNRSKLHNMCIYILSR